MTGPAGGTFVPMGSILDGRPRSESCHDSGATIRRSRNEQCSGIGAVRIFQVPLPGDGLAGAFLRSEDAASGTPVGPLGSSSSQHGRTLELVVQNGHSSSSLLSSKLSKSDQLPTTHCSPSTDNLDSCYRHPETVLGNGHASLRITSSELILEARVPVTHQVSCSV